MSYNDDREVLEAIAAGERALNSLKEARSSLESASGWGWWDILGGGLVSGLIKHRRIGDAQEELEEAQRDLAIFARELRDVHDLRLPGVQIDGWLTAADFLFDGFIADFLVQEKIKEAQERVDDAVYRVECALTELRSM